MLLSETTCIITDISKQVACFKLVDVWKPSLPTKSSGKHNHPQGMGHLNHFIKSRRIETILNLLRSAADQQA